MDRMRELIKLLNEANEAYYAKDREIMSNLAYDKLYEELCHLEKTSGRVLSSSPTQKVGYESVEELPKESHESPMLSLDKTKEVEELAAFVGSQKTLLSWKLDGLTIVLTYKDGELFKAVTRGNGSVGEVVTNNARVFKNLPFKIPFQGELILRGEAIISYSDFERINEEIEEAQAKYKNPRNLCSGSVRQLNNEITARRNVQFFAFGLVRAEGVDFKNSRQEQLEWLKAQGFEVVEYKVVFEDTVSRAVAEFSEKIKENNFPSDGLVALYDDISYGESLGNTAKFPRNAYAFKWQDEEKETRLLEVEWSASRTGLINPVAIFEPVELEGTTVGRAGVHNVSIVKSLELGVGDIIKVYKANMIIPQISENLSRTGTVEIPKKCPVCHQKTTIRREADVEVLVCPNPDCDAKKINAFTLFVSRDALNIDGLSKSTLEKFISMGLLHEFKDLFELKKHKEAIICQRGMGEKSFKKLADNIEKARHTRLYRVIYGLGIPNVGLSNAKLLCRAFKEDVSKIMQASMEEICSIDGMGSVIGESILSYFANHKQREAFLKLLDILQIEREKDSPGEKLKGLTFVITGSLNHFENRSSLKEKIESLGGKVTGSVTAKTSYLINNDSKSGSSKNKKARELGIPILTEEELLALTEQTD